MPLSLSIVSSTEWLLALSMIPVSLSSVTLISLPSRIYTLDSFGCDGSLAIEWRTHGFLRREASRSNGSGHFHFLPFDAGLVGLDYGESGPKAQMLVGDRSCCGPCA